MTSTPFGGGGPGHWRNGGGGGGGPNYGSSSGGGGGDVPHPHPRELVSPHSHHKTERDSKSNKTHETVVNMLSMLTLGVEEASSYEAQTSPLSSSSSNRNDYGNADNQRMLLLSMANTPESCLTLRRAGCIPLLVELIHPPRGSEGIQPPEIIQVRAARALKNIVQFNPDEKEKKKELRVLRLLEGIRLFTEAVKGLLKKQNSDAQDGDRNPDEVRATAASSESIQHPTTSLGAIMKLSYDSDHRCTMCLLGAIHCLSDLLVSDHLIHGNDPSSIKEDCFNLRRLTGMTLTNLTVYDKTNKALLCGMKDFLMCLVGQLESDNEEICKISASVLRNLSCRVDSVSMAALSEVSPCSKLMLAAMKAQKEATLKANLGAIWNLSAQSPKNMADISLASDDALPFLISLMKLNNPIMKEMKNPMTIIEHASGILRNISQHLRVVPELRKVLREHHCYSILLEHLKSSSMLVVGNACGALCSFSGGPECEEDQRKLLDLNAIPMLKSLVYSKDQRISQGSSTALRNLLSSKFAKEYTSKLDSRLGSQMYTSSEAGHTSDRSYMSIQQQRHNQPNSESDHEIENLVGRPHSSSSVGSGANRANHNRMVQPVPPVAHQQSTSSAASFYQQQRAGVGQNSVTVQFHNHPPLSLPLNQPGGGGYRNRPSTINYYPSDSEPLDLSAKSSPIHTISARAAEFAGMSSQLSPHHLPHQVQGAKNFHHNRSQSSQSEHHHQSYRFYNTNPDLVHHHHNQEAEQRQESTWQMDYAGASFNRSCPEILSRFQNSSSCQQTVLDSKPLDYSASGSASSSCRGGGEASASENLLNDSNGGGDTTFNYSLRFAEDDGDEDGNHHHAGSNSNTKSDDTVKTYCYEGTPQFSKSNSCQDLTACQDLVQELEFDRDEASVSNCNNGTGLDSSSGSFTKSSIAAANHKLQPIDEVKPYYVENTPAAFSRASSLSSIHSSDEATNAEINADFAESSDLQLPQQKSTSSDKYAADPDNQSRTIQPPPHPIPRKRSSLPVTPCRVTFSAEETPLMFSRCSSVASLDSDVGRMGPGEGGVGNGSRHDDDLSDYSRRASEVVSPSELPDSPRALVPPIRFLDNNNAVPPSAAVRRHAQQPQPNSEEDVVKVYSISMAEKSGFNSCRSLSPLTVDGEELQVIGKDKFDSTRKLGSIDAPCSKNDNNETVALRPPAAAESEALGDLADVADNTSKRRVFPPATDEMKIFATEGTPFHGVSNATSLSDLMADIDDVVVEDHGGGGDGQPNNSSTEPNINFAATKVEEHQRSTSVQNAALAVVNEVQTQIGDHEQETATDKEEPIYSDAQLLEKCIRVGKALGIPKSHSEFKIGSSNQHNPSTSTAKENQHNSAGSSKMNASLHHDTGKQKLTSKSQDFEFDDPDLAALIQIGRNRTTDKDKTPKIKSSKRTDKSKPHNHSAAAILKSKESAEDAPEPTSHSQNDTQIINNLASKVDKEKAEQQPILTQDSSTCAIPVEKSHSKLDQMTSLDRKSSTEECVSEDSPSTNNNDASNTSNSTSGPAATAPSLPLDPNQVSTMSLGSEWNDDTPTFSSPIPSMSISTAFKLVESVSMDNGKPPLPPKTHRLEKQNMNESFNNVSCLSVSVLLDNFEPPSTFSNLVSSSDCCGGSPQIQPRSQSSALSDKLNKKWKALTDAANNSSQSNLGGQKPPLDMENSMISIASINSEIASESIHNDVYESAFEDLGGHCKPSAAGDNSIGTYTIFPPENANRLSGVKSTDLSDGRNTVVSEDFTDAEDIEEYETAPMDDQSFSEEKADDEKLNPANENATPTVPVSTGSPCSQSTTNKPLMEVHPIIGSTSESNKYNTFVVKKSSMSPRSSPRQKRRDDPERYRTHTIQKNGQAFVNDANGNPSLKFATFRVGGPKVIKPLPDSQNMNMDSDSTNSPASTPGHSPKGIRGRRRPLYSSLPPSAIIRKERQNKSAAPPVPPKPVRTSSSPARSTTSSAAGGVYVRPTRTTELRNAANNSRDSSPPSRRIEATASTSSRNSSNSSLNLIHSSSRMSDYGGASSVCSSSHGRKVAPKPPLRTTPSMTPTNRDFSAPRSSSNVPIQIKASNSSFGLGQQTKMGDFNDCSNANIKGYSTLPKSSKFISPTPFSVDRYSLGGESKESIPGSEKSSRSGMGKITNLWKKMDFRSHKDAQTSNVPPKDATNGKSNNKLQPSEKDGKKTQSQTQSFGKSKLQNFFGRGKKEKPSIATPTPSATTGQQGTSNKANQPFRDPLSVHPDPACNIFSADTAPASTGGGRMRSREGGNKVIVPPFNYTPPDRSNSQINSSSNNGNSKQGVEDPTPAPRISSKITTV